MALVIAETLSDSPLTPEQPNDTSLRVLNCIAERNGSWKYSLLSRDRRHIFCIYDAPDAESVRVSYRQGGAAFKRIWSTTVVTPEGKLIERNEKILQVLEGTYPEGFTWEEWEEANSYLLPYYAEEGVEWVRSYVTVDRTRVVCEINALDGEVIRDAHRRFNIPFDRVWSAMVIKPHTSKL